MTRLWSLHPSLLDNKGLGGLWHETLRAQNGLAGKVKGYANHPQLDRFKAHPEPVKAIGFYLYHVWLNAGTRRKKNGEWFNYDIFKILDNDGPDGWANIERIPVTRGQVEYELALLRDKLKARGADKELVNFPTEIINCPLHPLFFMVEGDIEKWEKVK